MYCRFYISVKNLYGCVNVCQNLSDLVTLIQAGSRLLSASFVFQVATNYSTTLGKVSLPLLKRRHFEQLAMQVCFASPWIFSRLKHPRSNWRKRGAEQKVSGVVTAAFYRPMYQRHSSSQTWKSINWKQERFKVNHLCLFLFSVAVLYGLT